MSGVCARLAALLILGTSLTCQAAPPEATAYQITVDHAGVTASGGVLALQETPLWSVTLPGAISYPVIAGGGVFVTTAGLSGSIYGTQLYAFDALSGKPLWGPIGLSGTYFWSNMTYEGGKLFVVNFDGLLRSYDAATGTAGWSVQLPGQYAFSAPPTASGGTIYVGGAGSGGTLYAVNEANGAVVWTAGVANGDTSSPAVGPSGLYVSYPCQVYDFNLATGASIWHYNGPCEGGGGETPVYSNGDLYVRDPTSKNIIFNASSGAILPGNFTAGPPPAITATTSFFVNSGSLTAVDLASSTQKWVFAGDGSLVTAPIVVDQAVIVGSSSGNLYALDSATGNVAWQVQAPAALTGPAEGGATQPVTGLAVADGVLAVPAGSTLVVYSIFGPPAPAGLRATSGVASVQLEWTGAAGATSYNVYMGSQAGAEASTPLLTGVTGTSASITSGLRPGNAYFFTVKTVGTLGLSAASNEVSATPATAAPPANLTATPSVDGVTLSWTASTGATSYAVYMGTAAGGESATAAASGLTGTSTTVTGLTPGTTYYFVAKSFVAGVASAGSNEVSATPVAPVPVAPVDTQPPSSGGSGALEVLTLLVLALPGARRLVRGTPNEAA
jgi:outer membrane protein assembly factor BamB